MAQWKRNPNIFILTNIINLLKQSSFIIWADINTKEVNVEARTQTLWGISRNVNYSTMDFTVPIQKDTEREIFDYIDLDSIREFLDRINAKYDEEDLSNDIEEIMFLNDIVSDDNVSEMDVNLEWEEEQVVEYGDEYNTIEEDTGTTEEVYTEEDTWADVQSFEENQQ